MPVCQPCSGAMPSHHGNAQLQRPQALQNVALGRAHKFHVKFHTSPPEGIKGIGGWGGETNREIDFGFGSVVRARGLVVRWE